MMRLAGIVAFSLMLSASFATESFAQDGSADERASCANYGDLAESIMSNRQLGIALSQMMAVSEGNETFEMMVMRAYDVPQFSSEGMRSDAASRFRNEIEIECFKAQR
ncbi:hypothetical protein LGQ03_07365 [Loktanella sp. TSTF-M6]|uniref:HdeA/HdeB family protein n=1 Tax=Loktanella gaetbuli TaxID=2881335 RepID=A0ABS8BTJ0_9RHOB|nr:hypothetical protein [Loktanella gaetbuli]MCB5199055.1 hypothetical protein [Loktanella gaetbuli]